MKYSILLLTVMIFSLSLISQKTDKIGKLYSERKYNRVITLGTEELKEFPDNAFINMLVGRAHTESKHFKKAVSYLEKGTTKENNENWVQAWSYGYLGRCYYILDDYQKSKDCLNSCINLNATKNSIKDAQRLLNAYQMSSFYDNWEIIETKDIRFHFQDSDNMNNKEIFIKRREKAYIEINKFFEAKPYKKIDYFVWENPEEAEKLFGKPLGWANSDLCSINSSKNQTSGYEISHILTFYGFYPTMRRPIINEGIAVCFDQTNRDRMKVAKEHIGSKKISVIDYWKNPKKYSYDYNYSVGGALVAFLLKKGTEAQMKELLKNQTVDFARKIYMNFDQIIEDFEKELYE